ncbi:MAG: calcineurin-like phosphoesterase C-terminal domain-containing protein [Mangrovibacterium sp.]
MKQSRRKFIQAGGLSLSALIGLSASGILLSSCSKDSPEAETGANDPTTMLPDKEGMTVKGVVSCEGIGVPGVVVSDGYEVTTTDSEGRYYLPSLKKTGYVFISIPGNYEVATIGNAPQFFKRLNIAGAVEQKDFSLVKANNEKHVVIPMADWHLANRNNDLEQFLGNVLPDVNATIDAYSADGAKVYALTLGDLTWDLYWYDNNFGLKEYITYMNKLNCPVFNLIGNHDNDPYFANNWQAESTYRNLIGPTYYSFNLGKIHYVVLDSVEYLNTGASPGTIGERNYRDVIVADQLEWLKKDLATITDKSTPIVVAMHTPLYSNPSIDVNGKQTNKLALNNGSVLIDCLEEFSNVHVLSGHTHNNYSVEEKEGLIEHNTAAICATWWWTGKNGYAGNHICRDGSPGGYGVWEINGTQQQWYYKSIGYDKNYQFRSYDLNAVHITATKFAPNASDSILAGYAGPYAHQNLNNEVLINVWGFDNKWKIEVRENGQFLDVIRVKAHDPLHIISYEALRLNAGATPTSSFVTSETAHLFKVKASAPDSTLEIKVTDRFGRIYTETMERPKAFSLTMH